MFDNWTRAFKSLGSIIFMSRRIDQEGQLELLLESTLGVDTTVFPTLVNNAQSQS
jgi:hypothetical protein